MNKRETPMQELFDMLDEHYAFKCTNQDEWLEKEKEFAEEFFEAGSTRGYQNAIYIFEEEKTALNFEQVYSQYNERHRKIN